MPTQTLEAIPFHNTTIYAQEIDGVPHVALLPVCDAIGIDASSQRKRLKRQPWATEVIMTSVAADGKEREMTMVDRRTFTMWLATIDTSRIKDEGARELLVAFQREAADVLDAYFSGQAIGQAAIPEAIEYQFRLLERARDLLSPETLEAETLHVIRGEKPHSQVNVTKEPRPLPSSLGGERGWFSYREYVESRGVPANHSVIASLAVYTVRVFLRERGTAPGNLDGYRHLSPTRGGYITGFTEADLPLLDEAWAKVCQRRGV